jgi:AAA15 family ATPase/GTPase
MLISFSITNFRSIKNKQTIDMGVATKYHKKITRAGGTSNNLENNFFKTGHESISELLKSTVIYGPNASGKTNLIRAVYDFCNIIMCSDKNGNKRLRGDFIGAYDPFLLDEKSCKQPTQFEIDFIAEGIRYIYCFSYDHKRIYYERLEFYNGNKKELIYELKLDKKNKLEEIFTQYFSGKKDRSLDILRNTENNLFLPLNINEDGNKFLNPVYDWIENKLSVRNDHNSFWQTEYWISNNAGNKKNTVELLKKIDVGIGDLEVEISERELPKDIIESKEISDAFKLALKKEPVVRFKTINGYTLNKSQISLGTGAVFSLCSVILPILENGGVLFFDELERSLHPDAFIYIVKMFHDPKINKGNGQIVFTAHNDILLDKEYGILRRDQIWFTSKSNSQATELYSLAEFPTETKKRDNIVERYRNHCYGARPNLKEFRW